MIKNTENILHQHFDLNLARVKGLAAMILAVIASRSVQLSVMARYFSASLNPDTAFKRMQRFIAQITLPDHKIAMTIFSILGLKEHEKLKLILDRTNWKFGRAHLNFLFLAVSYRGVAIPVFFTVLFDKNQGNSNYLDRIELLEKFIQLFGVTRIECVIGDREFIGKGWIVWLKRMRIPFIMRLPENTTKIAICEGDFINANELFSSLKIGRKRFLGYCLIGETDSYKACVSALRTFEKQELVVLIHSEDIKNPFPRYLERWQIESMFRTMKTGGFNLESTHVTDPERLATLLAILTLAFCIALKAGKIALTDTPLREKKRLYGYKFD